MVMVTGKYSVVSTYRTQVVNQQTRHKSKCFLFFIFVVVIFGSTCLLYTIIISMLIVYNKLSLISHNFYVKRL